MQNTKISFKEHPIIYFYVLAFVISWLGWGPIVVGSRGIPPFNTPLIQILLILPALGPTLAAVIVEGAISGNQGVKKLLVGLIQWRTGFIWYLAAILGPILLFLGSQFYDLLVSGKSLALQIPGEIILSALVSGFVTNLLVNPWEEVGWRGFALPRLQERYSALVATLIVGLLWGLWHVPLFFWNGNPMSSYPFLPWLLGLVSESFIYTWMYNNTKGSLLIVSLFHIFLNTFGPIFHGSVIGLTVVNCVIAVILLIFYGPKRLSRQPV